MSPLELLGFLVFAVVIAAGIFFLYNNVSINIKTTKKRKG